MTQNMKRLTLLIILSALAVFSLEAQTILPNGVAVTPDMARGLDTPYDFSPVCLSALPGGYEAVFIEHYGRHGSRYAYSPQFYTSLKRVLDQGAAEGVLTPFGKDLLERYSAKFDNYMNRMGDLSDIGWDQLGHIARIMYNSYPDVFAGGDLKATASMSSRSIMSMSAFCVGFAQVAPTVPIKEDTGRVFLDGTNPRDRQNPFLVKRFEMDFPFPETLDEFQQRRVDPVTVLSRLFTDVDKACGGQPKHLIVRDLYVLVVGMNSVPEDERTDFTGVFTPDELALMWEVDNYQRYQEYFPYQSRCQPILNHFIKDADERIGKGLKGATTRFGHDHVVMPVLAIMGINGYERWPRTTDEISTIFTSWDSPMAANIQFIFYCPSGAAPTQENVIFRPLLNGRQVTLAFDPVFDGFYKWTDFKAWTSERNSVFVPLAETASSIDGRPERSFRSEGAPRTGGNPRGGAPRR